MEILGSLLDNLKPEQQAQWRHLTHQVERLRDLAETLPLLGAAERQAINEALDHARDRLRADQTYNISVIGFTGTGKSTLINAMLGRRLVVFKFGRSTTGTVVTVRQLDSISDDVSEGTEQIVIRYHTSETLTQLVETLFNQLNQKPIYKAKKLLDISKSLELVREKLSEGQAASKAAANSPLDEAEYHALLESLEDLLATAGRHADKLRAGANEEILPMDDTNIRRVQEMTDEKSPLNELGSDTRIIPLIRDVEYQIKPVPFLPDANLIDFPGPGALTARHESYLRAQLDPTKTTAIILVMAPRRAEAGTQEPLQRISDVLLRGLDQNTRRMVARRIFLVVSQRDTSTGTDPEVVEREVRDNVRKVARAITPDFFERYERSNIFLNVMALPALIAQLIDEHPEEAKAWQRGEKVSGAFQDIDYEHYQAIIERARDETDLEDAAQAVLALSEIPDLRQALNVFASRSRWELDLREAMGHYKRAYNMIADTINAQWTKVTRARPLGSEDTDVLLARLRRDQKLIYSEQIQKDVQKIQAYFINAYEALEERGIEQVLRTKLAQIVQAIEENIQAHTEAQAFKDGLTSQAVDMIYRETYVTSALPEPLIKLNRLVLEWFDAHAGAVAETMMQALQTQLDAEGVVSHLENACRGWSDTQGYLQIYDEEILDWMRRKYEHACRGYILSEVLKDNVTRKIKTEVEGQPSSAQTTEAPPQGTTAAPSSSKAWWVTHQPPSEREASGAAAAEAQSEAGAATQPSKRAVDPVAVIRRQYTEAHNQLAKTFTPQLTRLFRYHIAVATARLERLVNDLSLALAIEASTPGSHLYNQLQEEYGGYLSKAEELVDYWQQLRTFAV
jgi:hypothetical protein